MFVFFTTGFNDSIHIYLDAKKINEIKITSEAKTGWSDFFMIIPRTDSSQILTLLNIKNNRKSETALTKKYRYLYVHKGHNQGYDFVFSNSLNLPD